MHFPAFADDTVYQNLAATCSAALKEPSSQVFTSCYDTIRPLGLIIYHSIPNALVDDPVSRNYLMLLLNIFMLGIVIYAFFSMTRVEKDFFPYTVKTTLRNYMYISSLFIILLMLVAHLPVYLSDLPALSLFLLGLLRALIALNAPTENKNMRILVASLLLGCAGLLKQNYIAYGAIAGLALCYLSLSETTTNRTKALTFIKRFTFFGIGFSIVFAQFFWIYSHEGIFWAYLPSALDGIGSKLKWQPYLEMVIYTIPNPLAHVTQLNGHVDTVTFYATKVFLGLFKFDIAVYAGNAPFPPPELIIGTRQIIIIYFSVLTYCAITLFTYLRGPLALRYLSLVAFAFTIFTAISVHTEFRYYIFPRLIMYFSIFYFAAVLMAAINKMRSSKNLTSLWTT